MSKPYKIPQSVLVVIFTPARDVLLLRRTDPAEPAFWQSVTGSKDAEDEAFAVTAAREVLEETGIDCRPGTVLNEHLQDWHLENVYAIYPRWAHRYAPGVTHNTERVCLVCRCRKAHRCPSVHGNIRRISGCPVTKLLPCASPARMRRR